MSIDSVQKNWEAFAQTDPLWSILSDDAARNNRWNVDAFFATGRKEIDGVLAELEQHGLRPPRRRALDFGCGVGRLSQALARHFDSVVGVDIAPTMVEMARKYDETGKCSFLVNTSTAMPDVPKRSIDLVYSNIVLQHNEPPQIEAFLATLASLVAPGGVLVFQLPSERASVLKRLIVPLAPRWLLGLWRRRFWRGGPQMLMNGVPAPRVIRIVEKEGLVLAAKIPDASAGHRWNGYRYLFQRPA